MCYLADSFETAARETVAASTPAHYQVTGVEFVSQRELRILDLTDVPRSPSFFDERYDSLGVTLRFLEKFAADVSRPLDDDRREHVDYAPTQAFTEYVRYRLKVEGTRADGICYKSAKHPTGKSYVFFCGHDECLSEPTSFHRVKWFLADMASLKCRSATNYRG
jgi:hypothetical protein